MKKTLTVAVASAVILSGCASEPTEIKTRWGESVEVEGIAVTLTGNPDNDCYKLSIGNERWFRSISADEGGVVAGYAGVQDGDVQLYFKEVGPEDGRLDWGRMAPIDAGDSKSAKICRSFYATSSRVEVDVAGTTIIFR